MADWQAILDRHGPMVWRVASSMVGLDSDAADCFQETFLAAVELSRKQRVLSWSATLRAIAVNKANDCLRRRYRHGKRQEDRDTALLADGCDAAATGDAAARELAAALRRALATLEPRQARAFSLVAIESLSYAAAAEALGVSVNHVGVLVHRARHALKQQLAAYAPACADAERGDSRNG